MTSILEFLSWLCQVISSIWIISIFFLAGMLLVCVIAVVLSPVFEKIRQYREKWIFFNRHIPVFQKFIEIGVQKHQLAFCARNIIAIKKAMQRYPEKEYGLQDLLLSHENLFISIWNDEIKSVTGDELQKLLILKEYVFSFPVGISEQLILEQKIILRTA